MSVSHEPDEDHETGPVFHTQAEYEAYEHEWCSDGPFIPNAAEREWLNPSPDWAQLETDVVLKIHLLRAAWERTATMQIHPNIKRDIYAPALRRLAEFCACINVDGVEDANA